MPSFQFHPAVAEWFNAHFGTPSGVQAQAWPAIQAGQNTLIAAPTGSGKTLAAFMAAIDQLVHDGLQFPLADETQVLYVSPLKALSNDIHKNLELPLNGIRDALLENGYADVPIRAQVRTGDTTQSERAMMKRYPPHILVTTPESLYILLTSDSGREMLKTVRNVIVDEIHALAGNKRGAHLSLSLERLNQLCAKPPVRIGISATQKPIEDMALFLTGQHDDPVAQEAFIKAYRALPNFRGESAFYTWLYRIAINTAKNHLVAAGRKTPSYAVDVQEVEKYDASEWLKEYATPERELLADEIQVTVNTALEGLPPDLREAITLREIEGLSYEDIAQVMDCPIGTVRSRIFRAREAIDEKLQPIVDSSSHNVNN